jgi:putrescine aminotransferase
MVQNLFTIDAAEAMDASQIQHLYRQYVNPGQVGMMTSFGFGRELVVSAQGCWLETDTGRRILDFTGGMGVLNHGHNHPRILSARLGFQQQLRMEVNKNYFSPHLAALSHNIASLLPEDLSICYFPNSGAEAVEGAIKMAFKYHQGIRQQVLHADISYHGKLLGAASITGSEQSHFHFPRIPGTHAFEYGNLESVQGLVSRLRRENGESDIYALIIEPMSASTLLRCNRDYLVALRKLCDTEGIVLIFDEVFSGWCKSGELFYFMEHGVTPDLLVASKSLGGGKASISAFVAREPIFRGAYGNLSDALLHSTTYNGFGEECATALEAVNILIEDNYKQRSRNIGDLLGAGLRALQEKYPGHISEVRGQGALQGILLETHVGMIGTLPDLIPIGLLKEKNFVAKLIAAAVINHLYRQHNMLTYHEENRDILLMAAPSLVIEPTEIEQYLCALDATLNEGLPSLCARFVASKLFNSFVERFRREPDFSG